MEYLLIYVLTIIGGIILYAIMSAVIKAPGALLAAKFASLGDMNGKTYEEIKKVVGGEISFSSTVNDSGEVVKIRKWISIGYYATLLFDEDDNCICISSETKVKICFNKFLHML